MLRPAYPPDLTDAQSAILQPSIPLLKPGGRPGSHARAFLGLAKRWVDLG
jgi:hypothetical protein